MLGESIASTSLTAASASIDVISNLLDEDDEASFSLVSFVALVRREWAEHGATGRGVTEVARAVAAWAAIQGFTKQWSEERWLKSVKELKLDGFNPPISPKMGGTAQRPRAHTLNRVSVTDDVIMPGRFGQVVSADIGEKDITIGMPSSSSVSSPSHCVPSHSSPIPYRSNYEISRNLRRLSKMVLAGYGGAGLLFFGTPLRPDKLASVSSQCSAHDPNIQKTDTEVKDSEEDILVHVVEDAEAEAMSPPMRNVILLEESSSGPSTSTPRRHLVNPAPDPTPPAPSSKYSWWNVLLGKHDREIFEGFAFTPPEDHDKNMPRSPLSLDSTLPSSTTNTFIPARSGHRGSPLDVPPGTRNGQEPEPPTAMIGDMSSMPRFWVLTDHGRRQVVLVVRGTLKRCARGCHDQSFNTPGSVRYHVFQRISGGTPFPSLCLDIS